MDVISCSKCKHNEITYNGLCPKRTASDKEPVRCIGHWSQEKFHYLRKYVYAFATSTKKKWRVRNYIDLFCGPGICFDRKEEKEIYGSPLIALNTDNPFLNYYFIDKDPNSIKALRKRTQDYGNVHILQGDCNDGAIDIFKKISPYSINLAFIDPTGLDINFTTVQNISYAGRGRVDLIINFPLGTAIKRNIHAFIKKEESKLDAFMGTNEWREAYERIKNKEDGSNVATVLIKIYNQQLKKLGYKVDEIGLERVVKNDRGLPLYYLIFASRHPLGKKFWKDIGLIEPSGQRRLPF